MVRFVLLSTALMTIAAGVSAILSPKQMAAIFVEETLKQAIPDFAIEKPAYGYNFSSIVTDDFILPPFKITNCSLQGQQTLHFQVDNNAALSWHSNYEVHFNSAGHPKALPGKQRSAQGDLTALCNSLLLQFEAYYVDGGKLEASIIQYTDFVPTDFQMTNFDLDKTDYQQTVLFAYNAFGWQYPEAFYTATKYLVDRLNAEGLDQYDCP